MRRPHRIAYLLLTLVLLAPAAQAQDDPGSRPPAASEVSDQKAGSVLFFNFYSSNPVNPNVENTLLNFTNTSTTASAIVHFFFVDGATSMLSTSLFCCLTPNQTAVLLASEVDPGVAGYVIGVVVNAAGCPISFNFLIGDEYVKLATGHTANLGAEAFAALYRGTLPGCGTAATLSFDGVQYNRAPRVLALDKFRSPTDGNSTLLVINRLGGSLVPGGQAAPVGRITGEVANDRGNAAGFTFTSNSTQVRGILSDSFPGTSPPLSTVVPSGRTGWIRLFGAADDVGLLGSVINFNPNVRTSLLAFKGSHNLRNLTLAAATTLVIPVGLPNCS